MDQSGLVLQGLTLIIIALGTFVAVRQLTLLRRQLEEMRQNTIVEQDWNRRRATQEYLYQVLARDVPMITQEIEKEFGVDIYDPKQTYGMVAEGLESDQSRTLEMKVKALFNMFELIAVGIKNNILDDEIAHQYGGFLLPAYLRWGSDLVGRFQEKNRTIWVEFEATSKRWGKRM